MASSITNVTSNLGPLPQHVEVNNSTATSLTLNQSWRYRILHTGLAYDMGTGATGVVYLTSAINGETPTTVTAATTGALGRTALIIQANNPDLASVVIGPGVSSVSFLSSAGSPVVRIDPILPSGNY